MPRKIVEIIDYVDPVGGDWNLVPTQIYVSWDTGTHFSWVDLTDDLPPYVLALCLAFFMRARETEGGRPAPSFGG